jgi:hypothetical protein
MTGILVLNQTLSTRYMETYFTLPVLDVTRYIVKTSGN